MRARPATHPSLADERGMTLIELLVASVLAIVVIGALFAIFELSLGQEARIADRAQADQVGRATLNKIVDRLHSSCTGFGDTAIQAPEAKLEGLSASGATSLWFLTAYGSSSAGNAIPEGLTLHDVAWSATKTIKEGSKETTLGTLTDYSFAAGKSGAVTIPATLAAKNATSTVIAKNVVVPESGAIFTYFKYNTSGELEQLKSSELPLSTTTAELIAKVGVNVVQAPEDEKIALDRNVSLSSAVVFRYDPTNTASGSEETAPCE